MLRMFEKCSFFLNEATFLSTPFDWQFLAKKWFFVNNLGGVLELEYSFRTPPGLALFYRRRGSRHRCFQSIVKASGYVMCHMAKPV